MPALAAAHVHAGVLQPRPHLLALRVVEQVRARQAVGRSADCGTSAP
ncbi:hypothetical protein [Dactylosporangium sp. NPDC050588]